MSELSRAVVHTHGTACIINKKFAQPQLTENTKEIIKTNRAYSRYSLHSGINSIKAIKDFHAKSRTEFTDNIYDIPEQYQTTRRFNLTYH